LLSLNQRTATNNKENKRRNNRKAAHVESGTNQGETIGMGYVFRHGRGVA